VSVSDAPVREPGTRARSGNAMARTRAALLTAAHDCLARYGIRKTTMVDVASRSGVAKATLYNHFRTKDDLLAALVEDRVAALTRTAIGTAAAQGLAAALAELATVLADDAALRRAAADEPALLAPLASGGSGRGWQLAREGVVTLLAAARVEATPGQVDLLLRWLVSQVLWPVGPEDRSSAAVVEALSAVPAAPQAPEPAPAAPTLGWPTVV
jgi:AcrR family transcriptional regulator